MKSIFLERVFAGYEIMRVVHQNRWKLIRCIPLRKGTRLFYMES